MSVFFNTVLQYALECCFVCVHFQSSTILCYGNNDFTIQSLHFRPIISNFLSNYYKLLSNFIDSMIDVYLVLSITLNIVKIQGSHDPYTVSHSGVVATFTWIRTLGSAPTSHLDPNLYYSDQVSFGLCQYFSTLFSNTPSNVVLFVFIFRAVRSYAMEITILLFNLFIFGQLFQIFFQITKII